jgi:hypothetical protein
LVAGVAAVGTPPTRTEQPAATTANTANNVSLKPPRQRDMPCTPVFFGPAPEIAPQADHRYRTTLFGTTKHHRTSSGRPPRHPEHASPQRPAPPRLRTGSRTVRPPERPASPRLRTGLRTACLPDRPVPRCLRTGLQTARSPERPVPRCLRTGSRTARPPERPRHRAIRNTRPRNGLHHRVPPYRLADHVSSGTACVTVPSGMPRATARLRNACATASPHRLVDRASSGTPVPPCLSRMPRATAPLRNGPRHYVSPERPRAMHVS